MHQHHKHHGHGRRHERWMERRTMRRFWFGRRGGPFGGRRGGPFGGNPFGDDPFGGDEGPRRRHRRGDIRIALLELLAEQPRHGYELIKALEQRYAGFYRPSPGSVYPTLQLLEDEGHLTSEQVEGKRVYTITASGQAELEQQRAEGGHHMHGAPGAHLDELRRSAVALTEVVMQAARHGTPEQAKAVMATLDQTRREIHRILGGS